MSINRVAREELQEWFVRNTKCSIQDGWPCGTCALDLLKRIGLRSQKKEYKEHNKPVDRANEVWRAILQIRKAR